MKEDQSLGEMMDEVFSNIWDKTLSGLDKALGSWREKNQPIPAKDPRLVEKNPRVKTLADLCFGLGLGGTVVSGILTVSLLVGFSLENLFLTILCGLATLAFGLALWRSRYYKDAFIRLNKYLRALENGSVARVDQMARLAGVSTKLAIQDLKSFIQDNTFKEAQLVENEGLFILDYSSYKLYEKQVEKLDKAQGVGLKGDSPSQDEDYLEGKKIFKTIKAHYPLLRKEGQTKLLPLMTTIERIYRHVDAYPENRQALGKFNSYYLPSLEALVDRYLLLQETENLNQSRQALAVLEKSFGEINQAFEGLLDHLGGAMARDTLSEVSVLKMLMKQDGLLDRDFEMEDVHGGKRN